MKCDLLLVCSNFLPVDPMSSTTREEYAEDQIVAFTELGNLAQRYGVKIGHEALAWGTAVNRWDQVWDIVERVDLPNVGIILDSFNQLYVVRTVTLRCLSSITDKFTIIQWPTMGRSLGTFRSSAATRLYPYR
jgi:hypothetical protein